MLQGLIAIPYLFLNRCNIFEMNDYVETIHFYPNFKSLILLLLLFVYVFTAFNW